MHNFNVELRDDYRNKRYSIDELLEKYDFKTNYSDYKAIFSIICMTGNKEDFDTFFNYKNISLNIKQNLLLILMKKGNNNFLKENFNNYLNQLDGNDGNTPQSMVSYLFSYDNLKQTLNKDNILFLFENYYEYIPFKHQIDKFIIENNNEYLFKLIQKDDNFQQYFLSFQNKEEFDFILKNIENKNKIFFLLDKKEVINNKKYDFTNFLTYKEAENLKQADKTKYRESWFNEQLDDFLLKNKLNEELINETSNSINKNKRKI